MVKINPEDRKFVSEVATAMLMRCDGARAEDGVGYNKFDSARVRNMNLDRDTISLSIILIKYKNQITSMGFDHERIVKIANSVERKKKDKNVKKGKNGKAIKTVSVTVNGDYLKIISPYNEGFLAWVRTLKGRFNGDDKSWSVSIGYIREVLEAVDNYYGNYDNIEFDLVDPSDVNVGEIFCNGIKEDVLVAMKYNHNFVAWIKENDVFKFNKKWDNNKKAWRITVANKDVVDEIFKMAEMFGIKYSEEAEKNMEAFIDYFDERIEMSSADDSKFNVKGLGGELFPFQTAGVRFAEELDGRLLIADEMGLGKTVQALAYLQHHPEVRPAVIIVPNCVKENWRRETIKWVSQNNETVVVNGGKDFVSGDITILNYDIVKKHKDAILDLNPQCVILDESHYIKNFKAQRTKAVQEICRASPHIIALSGTPMLNRPIELWTVANMIAPNTFNNWQKFVKRYCAGFQDSYGWNVSGSSNLDELQALLRQTMMIRRLKADVLKELPEKMRETVFMDVSGKAWSDYMEVETNFINWLKENLGEDEKLSDKLMAEAILKINKLRTKIVDAKMKSVKEWVNNFMDSSTGKLVLFCHHRKTIKAMKEAFPDILSISGEDSAEDRQKAVDSFQNDDSKRLIVLTFGAGGVGLTLTKAQNVAFIELAWRPADLSQAEDRIHRIGQEGQVTAWYLLVPNSIDETMMGMINEKMEVSAKALDKDAEVSIQRNLITSFLNRGEEKC